MYWARGDRRRNQLVFGAEPFDRRASPPREAWPNCGLGCGDIKSEKAPANFSSF